MSMSSGSSCSCSVSSRAPHVQGANGAPCHDVNNVILCLLRWYCDHHLRWVWKDLVRKKCDLRWCCRIETRKATEWGVGWVKSDKRAVQQKQWSKKMGLSERIKDGKVRMLKWNLLDILLSDLAQMYSEFYSRLEHFTQVIYSGCFTWTFCPDILPRHFAQTFCPDILPRHFAQTFCPDVLPRCFAQLSPSRCLHFLEGSLVPIFAQV